jgi:hypothetical protein
VTSARDQMGACLPQRSDPLLHLPSPIFMMFVSAIHSSYPRTPLPGPPTWGFLHIPAKTAYIETFQRRAATPTVKQHTAAIRMMFSWLTERGVLAMNPAGKSRPRDFRGPKGKHRHSSMVKSKSFSTRSRHPRTQVSAIARCLGLLPILSPGSAPS